MKKYLTFKIQLIVQHLGLNNPFPNMEMVPKGLWARLIVIIVCLMNLVSQ